MRVTYEDHAAHCGQTGQVLWDLECYHVASPYGAPRPPEVPSDAEKHSGYRKDGQQIVVWTRRLSPRQATCSRCR
jgi:hypothetical protein